MNPLYRELADWWPLFSAPADYKEEAAVLQQWLNKAVPPPVTVLELGSGGGNLASHLKQHYRLTLSDLSEDMLRVSRRLNPECEHMPGDMRTLRLGRTFDAVLVQDAIMYLRTEEELTQTIETLWVHLRPGGVAVILPDCVSETYTPRCEMGGEDDAEGRGVRYLEWDGPPAPDGGSFRVDYVLALREASGATRVVHDTHTMGLFPRAEWLRRLEAQGFAARRIADPWRQDCFIAHKPEL